MVWQSGHPKMVYITIDGVIININNYIIDNQENKRNDVKCSINFSLSGKRRSA